MHIRTYRSRSENSAQQALDRPGAPPAGAGDEDGREVLELFDAPREELRIAIAQLVERPPLPLTLNSSSWRAVSRALERMRIGNISERPGRFLEVRRILREHLA